MAAGLWYAVLLMSVVGDQNLQLCPEVTQEWICDFAVRLDSASFKLYEFASTQKKLHKLERYVRYQMQEFSNSENELLRLSAKLTELENLVNATVPSSSLGISNLTLNTELAKLDTLRQKINTIEKRVEDFERSLKELSENVVAVTSNYSATESDLRRAINDSVLLQNKVKDAGIKQQLIEYKLAEIADNFVNQSDYNSHKEKTRKKLNDFKQQITSLENRLTVITASNTKNVVELTEKQNEVIKNLRQYELNSVEIKQRIAKLMNDYNHTIILVMQNMTETIQKQTAAIRDLEKEIGTKTEKTTSSPRIVQPLDEVIKASNATNVGEKRYSNVSEEIFHGSKGIILP